MARGRSCSSWVIIIIEERIGLMIIFFASDRIKLNVNENVFVGFSQWFVLKCLERF